MLAAMKRTWAAKNIRECGRMRFIENAPAIGIYYAWKERTKS
jgi:hypothetical protein